MRSRIYFCTLLMLSGIFLTVSAQGVGSWDTDFVEQSNAFMVGSDGSLQVEYWVDNRGPGSVQFSVEFDVPFSAKIGDGAEREFTLESGENKTFDAIFEDITVRDHDAGTTDSFKIEITRVSTNGVSGGYGEDSLTLEALAEIPRVTQLELHLSEPGGPITAGTSAEIALKIENKGNGKDSVDRIESDTSCPQLEISGEQDAVDLIINPSSVVTVNVFLTPSSAHPSTLCRLAMRAWSSADADAGDSGVADNVEITVDVVAIRDAEEIDELSIGKNTSSPSTESLGRYDASICTILVLLFTAQYNRRQRNLLMHDKTPCGNLQ